MKRILNICEGETEQKFCNDILMPYLLERQIFIQPLPIEKSHGGIVSWGALKRQIENQLKGDPSAYITTMIDYYGIHASHQFPLWLESLKIVNRSTRLDFLEARMLEDIDVHLRHRFIPYIQLHEFEGLLFSDEAVFLQQFSAESIRDANLLHATFAEYADNPELINDNVENAPSKRLNRIIADYSKVRHGNLLAISLGIDRIMSKCPRFHDWISTLENL
jgi:hypothetical protein